jgi:hypothetical protein
MRLYRTVVAGLVVAGLSGWPAEAAIIGFSPGLSSAGASAAIIAPPATLINSTAFNTAQQGFDELQGVLLGAPVLIDGGGSIAAGTVVDSHMIFLNQQDGVPGTLSHIVTWTFSGTILGVMSQTNGGLEALSTPILGLPGTTYATFGNRGLESNDDYTVLGNQITLDLRVTQPGDWVRVVTASPVPEPGTLLLIGSGLAGLALRRRRA